MSLGLRVEGLTQPPTDCVDPDERPENCRGLKYVQCHSESFWCIPFYNHTRNPEPYHWWLLSLLHSLDFNVVFRVLLHLVLRQHDHEYNIGSCLGPKALNRIEVVCNHVDPDAPNLQPYAPFRPLDLKPP